MVISAITTIALYCPYCGIPHLHDLNQFFLRTGSQQELLCSCGKFRAVVLSSHYRQWIFQIPCIVCGSEHIICVDRNRLAEEQAIKLYCNQENMELGLIGAHEVVKKMVAEQQSAVSRLFFEPSANEEKSSDPQLLFAALNRIHDIAEAGGLFCHCGSKNIQAFILADCIEIRCMACGNHTKIAAHSKEDLKHMANLTTIELMDYRKSHRQR
jgi:hypothetical protein